MSERRGSLTARLAVPGVLLLLVLLVLWAGIVDVGGRSSSPVGSFVRPEADPLEVLSRVRQGRAIPRLPDLACAPENVIRPNSGDELGGSYRGGLSRLQIVNGTDHDAVAVLVESGPDLPRRAIYVRAHEAGRITQIPAGVYRLQFQLGSSWPRRGPTFCDVRGTSEFDRSLRVEERGTYDGVEYSTFEITLHPVPEGTAKTHSISPSAFRLPPPS